jgi:uncharacterized protein (TIGR00369 family)
MSKLIELVEKARRENNPGLLTDAIPYARWVGISVEEHNGSLRGLMRFKKELIGNPVLPALHGGTTGALLESTGIFSLLWKSETVLLPKTINLTIDYLRSARPVDTFAKAIVVKQGRRVASVRMEAWQEDPLSPIAAANAHFLIKPEP